MAERSRRTDADAVLAAVKEGGSIQWETLEQLFSELARRGYRFHLAVEVQVGALLKTIDNERDALETLSRLRTETKRRRARKGSRVRG